MMDRWAVYNKDADFLIDRETGAMYLLANTTWKPGALATDQLVEKLVKILNEECDA